jgi:glycosyltransferase involved in cell wall biosynthesis
VGFDLVLPTVGRAEDLTRFLRALETQSYRHFRLLVVDQNSDDRLVQVLAPFETAFEMVRLRSEPGLSRARNVALAHVTADVVAFPDDDCWYPANLLARVAGALDAHAEWDGLGVRPVDEHGRQAAGREDPRPGPMTLSNLWRRVGSYTLFLRRDAVEAIGEFDEELGVGAGTPWGGGEDLDYVARAVRAGRRIYYDPTLVVHHPRKREHVSDPDPQQGYAYGAGFGRALRKNGIPWWFAAYSVVRSSGASLLNLLAGRPARARFYLAVARGRLRGWTSASP